MAGSYLPPVECIFHGKQDWEEKGISAFHPPLIPLVEEDLQVPTDIQVQFELAQHTKVQYIPGFLWGRGCGPS